MSAASQRVVALGIRMADGVTGLPVRDGLRAWASPVSDERVRIAGESGPSGQIVWARLPGTSAWRAGGAPTRAPRFLLEVEDRQERYLPVRVEAEAQSQALVSWVWGSKKERRPLVPMYHGSSGPALEGHASIYAELWDLGASAPAAWSLLSARAGTGERAVTSWGLADARGRVRVVLPWPEPGLSTGKPLAEATWALSLRVRFARRAPASLPPNLDAIERQPLARLWRDADAKLPMSSATLRFGTELVLRGDSSSSDYQPLYVTP